LNSNYEAYWNLQKVPPMSWQYHSSVAELEELLIWKWNLYKVIARQNVQEPVGKYTLACHLLEGDALAAFDHAAHKYKVKMDENFE